jgi:hypothetical protein
MSGRVTVVMGAAARIGLGIAGLDELAHAIIPPRAV